MKRIYSLLFFLSLLFAISGCRKSSEAEPAVVLRSWFISQEGSSDTLFVLYIPTAFTPNGDGINDVFMLSGTHLSGGFDMKIFAGNGEQVYESSNSSAVWDGRIAMLTPAPAGVYAYLINIQIAGKEYTCEGAVYLLR